LLTYLLTYLIYGNVKAFPNLISQPFNPHVSEKKQKCAKTYE